MIEKTIHSTRAYDGRILKLDLMEVELENGQRARREVVRHTGAVAVIGVLPDNRFVFVRQFRKPVEREVIEVVAGCLDPGEDPAECAAREVREETGYRVSSLESLGPIYPSPGYSDEVIHVFKADLLPERNAPEPDEDEKIEVIHLPRHEFEQMIRARRIQDSKTLAAWLLYDMAGQPP